MKVFVASVHAFVFFGAVPAASQSVKQLWRAVAHDVEYRDWRLYSSHGAAWYYPTAKEAEAVALAACEKQGANVVLALTGLKGVSMLLENSWEDDKTTFVPYTRDFEKKRLTSIVTKK